MNNSYCEIGKVVNYTLHNSTKETFTRISQLIICQNPSLLSLDFCLTHPLPTSLLYYFSITGTKLSQMQWLKTELFSCSGGQKCTVSLTGLKSGCRQGWLLLGAAAETLFLAFSSLWWLPAFPGCGCTTPIPACVITLPSLLSL